MDFYLQAYNPNFAEKAYKLALLGADERMFSIVFDVPTDAIKLWKENFPEFREAILRGQTEADANVAYALYKNATGYYYEEDVIVSFKGQSDVVRVKKYKKPDSWAANKWLEKRQKDKWAAGEKINVKKETNIHIDKMDLSLLSNEELNMAKKLGLLTQQQFLKQ